MADFLFYRGINIMKNKLLKLLSQNAKYTTEELSIMAGASENEIKEAIATLEGEGIIRGYKAVVDWDSLANPKVSAVIELKVIPQAEYGFERIAKKVMNYDEVESVYLMSGAYDLCVMVKANTFRDVAMFVARELATIEGVTGTATHFVIRRYKELDIPLVENDKDDRGAYSL